MQNSQQNTRVKSALTHLSEKRHYNFPQCDIYCKCKAISGLNEICTGVCDIELLCIIIVSCTTGPMAVPVLFH